MSTDEVMFAASLVGVLLLIGIGVLWWDARKKRQRQRWTLPRKD